MPVPLPPPDGSGGIMVVKYTNGTITHRIRLHVLAFNTDATMTYTAPPTGGEASVSATFAAFAAKLAPFLNNGWTISLDAVYLVLQPAGTVSQYFGYTPPATVAGTSAVAAGAPEGFISFNWRTAGGHRIRFFAFSTVNWAYGSASIATPVSGGNAYQQMAYYMVSSTTAVVGHDGARAVGSCHNTFGVNKRIRRKVGNA